MTSFSNIFICFYWQFWVHAEILYPWYRNSVGEMFLLFYSSKHLTCARIEDINLRSNVELKSVWNAYVLSCHKRILRNAFILFWTFFHIKSINLVCFMSMGIRAWVYHVCIIHFMSYLCLCRYNIQNNGFQLTPHSAHLIHIQLNGIIRKKGSFCLNESQIERVIVLQIN